VPPVIFERRLIADERFESAGVFDVDNDGHVDIVSGAFWYPGPDFDVKIPICEVSAHGEYFDDFATLALDVDGDGYLDIVTGGWWGPLRWRQNPRGDRLTPWQEHVIAELENIETVRAWDVDGDGVLEIVPNTPLSDQRVYKLVVDEDGRGAGRFVEHMVYAGVSGHGLGFGDINGDGRGDIVLSHGWLEAPDDPWNDEWVYHPDFDLGESASIPILVVDPNADGLNDLIVGCAHGYGLSWWEQGESSKGRTWKHHPIDPFNSQYHDLAWVDLDGDGEAELVTGKRYRAHSGFDPGEYDPVGIYYFKWTGEGFAKQVIDYGSARDATGCGISFCGASFAEGGRVNLVAPGKDGLFLFVNKGFASNLEPTRVA
jgi:hypothetical protein